MGFLGVFLGFLPFRDGLKVGATPRMSGLVERLHPTVRPPAPRVQSGASQRTMGHRNQFRSWLGRSARRKGLGTLEWQPPVSPNDHETLLDSPQMGPTRCLFPSSAERCRWEEKDGVADPFARRGESEARPDGRPVTSEHRSSCGRRCSQHDRSNCMVPPPSFRRRKLYSPPGSRHTHLVET